MADLTYDEMRSNAEKIADTRLKERILHGLKLLQEEFGDAWVEHIDPAALDMGDANSCVLGQVFGVDGMDIKPTVEQLAQARRRNPERFYWDNDGFTRGLAVLDGDLVTEHAGHVGGFNTEWDEEWSVLQNAWWVVFGYEPEGWEKGLGI